MTSIADGALRQLDPRFVAYSRALGGWAMLIVVPPALLASALVAVLVDLPAILRIVIPASALVLAGLWGILVWTWPVLEHRHASYRVTPDEIEIRGGVLWRKIIAVSRSRVQHTDVSQGPLERNFGLARLHVYTAGTEHSQVTLHGIDHATALSIRDHLLVTGHGDAV